MACQFQPEQGQVGIAACVIRGGGSAGKQSGRRVAGKKEKGGDEAASCFYCMALCLGENRREREIIFATGLFF